MYRICTKCNERLPLDSFYRNPSIRPDGVRKHCKPCRNAYRRAAHAANPHKIREYKRMENKYKVNERAKRYRKENRDKFKGYHLKKEFGLTLEDFNSLLVQQDGVCAICREPEKSVHKSGTPKDLSVDHDHKTGAIRGLLCWVCNTGIGKLRDSPDLLRTAANYIEKYRK